MGLGTLEGCGNNRTGLRDPVWNPSFSLGCFSLWLMPGYKLVFNPSIVIIF